MRLRSHLFSLGHILYFLLRGDRCAELRHVGRLHHAIATEGHGHALLRTLQGVHHRAGEALGHQQGAVAARQCACKGFRVDAPDGLSGVVALHHQVAALGEHRLHVRQ